MTLELLPGLQVADRFRLERELGRGGMGSVWLARHTGLDILCAIKFIDQQGRDSTELRARFEREARSAAQLKSPHVVQILDYGVWQEHPYIAMEYLEGEDLAARLDTAWVLTPEQTCQIIGQVAKALMKAHAAGIVHRDLKPENVFLVRDGDEEVAKVLDFGIAKSSSMAMVDTGTKTGSLLGTPYYMSPEQARGVKSIDHRSDLWSLAVMVYQCVTGQLPFESEGLGDVLAKIMYEPLPVPSEVKPDVPKAFDVWWKRASSRKAEERFQSAKELSEELAIALGVAGAAPGFEQTSWGTIRTSLVESDSALSLSGTVRVNATATARSGAEHGPTPAGDTASPLITTVSGSNPPPRTNFRFVAAVGVAALAMLVLGIIALTGSGSAPPSAPSAAQNSPPKGLQPQLGARPAPEAAPVAEASAPAVPLPSPAARIPADNSKPQTQKSFGGKSPSTVPTAPRRVKNQATKPGEKKPVDFGI